KHAASVHPEPGSNSPQKTPTNVSINSVKDYRAVKSPKPNQNKPHQHHKQDAGLAHPKITRQTKKVHPTLLPQSTRKKDNNKKI
ncbi:hypothetical protein QP968_08330, partial [Corynebacterium sp. MSK041]|uniref:hypothetical protein n=1 Tax=Corynebacterium sp. MSK041 TaxID=3050194 RepID=UPI00254D5D90